jgi:hypothetical protein
LYNAEKTFQPLLSAIRFRRLLFDGRDVFVEIINDEDFSVHSHGSARFARIKSPERFHFSASP